LYINQIEDGEVFGSADPSQHQQITMYIENAGLSPFHASIKYLDSKGKFYFSSEKASSETGFYMLKDEGSQTGTWSSVKQSYASQQNWMLTSLNDSAHKVFWVGENQFVISKEHDLVNRVWLLITELESRGLSEPAVQCLRKLNSQTFKEFFQAY
jgi:hypothetical protein